MVLAVPAVAFQRGDRGGNVPGQRSGDRGGKMHGPGPHAGDWLRQNMNLSPTEQRNKLQNDDQFKKLPPNQQERLINRLDRFNNLSPEQKQRWLNRMEWLEHLTPMQRERAKDLHLQMQTLEPERRKAIRKSLHQMKDMSTDDRAKAIDSDKMKSSFNDHERDIMRGMSELGMPSGGDDDNTPQ